RCAPCGTRPDVPPSSAAACSTTGRGMHRRASTSTTTDDSRPPRIPADRMAAMSDDLTWLDATESAALVRRGEVTPLELVDAAIERIERLDPELNAVIIRRFEQA